MLLLLVGGCAELIERRRTVAKKTRISSSVCRQVGGVTTT